MKDLTCHQCGKTFTSLGSLTRHQVVHSEDKPFKCKFCHQGFKLNFMKTNHERTHSTITERCDICGESFKDVKQHKMRIHCHDAERKYPCEICGKELSTETCLKDHTVRMHMNDNKKQKEKCKICNKGYYFTKEKTLDKHMEKHKLVNTVKCEVCFKVFRSNAVLNTHTR